jgi:hypothetical protein
MMGGVRKYCFWEDFSVGIVDAVGQESFAFCADIGFGPAFRQYVILRLARKAHSANTDITTIFY